MDKNAPTRPGQKRRTLIQILLGSGFTGSIAAFLYPAVKFMMPPEISEAAVNEVTAGKVEDLQPNSARIFKFGNRPGILIRNEEGQWRAFSAICTHLNCTVQYRRETRQIWCACHNGLFDLQGRVVSGPPPGPLEEFKVNVRGDDVVVSRGA